MTSPAVSVELGARRYDIYVEDGLVDAAGALLGPLLRRPFAAIVSDANVDAVHGERLRDSLSSAGVQYETIVLPPGEATKSFSHLESLTEALLGLGVERGDLVIAFGGGVIGDLTGFAASILRRGCRFAQIPTTLLAQVDSSVGGKTAINVRQGKNLIGAFYQPAVVLADISVLDTLPPRQLRAGYAEIVKYAALGDEAFFVWLERSGPALIAGNRTVRREAVVKSCASKAAIVASDEREEGARALLNLGHTFGHALEAACGFSDRLLHGEAVACGMALAFDFSVSEGHCHVEDAARLKAHLTSAELPARLGEIEGAAAFSPEMLLNLMMQDKKVAQGRLTLILARRIGEAFIAPDVSAEKVLRFLAVAQR